MFSISEFDYTKMSQSLDYARVYRDFYPLLNIQFFTKFMP